MEKFNGKEFFENISKANARDLENKVEIKKFKYVNNPEWYCYICKEHRPFVYQTFKTETKEYEFYVCECCGIQEYDVAKYCGIKEHKK